MIGVDFDFGIEKREYVLLVPQEDDFNWLVIWLSSIAMISSLLRRDLSFSGKPATMFFVLCCLPYQFSEVMIIYGKGSAVTTTCPLYTLPGIVKKMEWEALAVLQTFFLLVI